MISQLYQIHTKCPVLKIIFQNYFLSTPPPLSRHHTHIFPAHILPAFLVSASHSLNTSTSALPEHSFSSGCLSQRLSTQPTPAHASAVVLFILPIAFLLPRTVSDPSTLRDTSHSSDGSESLSAPDAFHNLHFPSYRLLCCPHAVFS